MSGCSRAAPAGRSHVQTARCHVICVCVGPLRVQERDTAATLINTLGLIASLTMSLKKEINLLISSIFLSNHQAGWVNGFKRALFCFFGLFLFKKTPFVLHCYDFEYYFFAFFKVSSIVLEKH